MVKNKLIGFILVILAAFFWGIGGTISQKLFQAYEIPVGWLVSARLLIGGFLLLIIQSIFKDMKQVFRVWQTDAVRLVIYGVVGMLAVQYTYLVSIDYGNAAVATLLQYLAPVMIIIWLIITKQSTFTKKDAITVSSCPVRLLLFINEWLDFCVCCSNAGNYLGAYFWCNPRLLYVVRYPAIKKIRFARNCRLGNGNWFNRNEHYAPNLAC